MTLGSKPEHHLAPDACYVLRCIESDRRLYAQIHATFGELSVVERQARRVLPYAAYLLEDLFQAYYQPRLDANSDLSAALHRHAAAINQLTATTSFPQMRRSTTGDSTLSIWAALITLRHITEHLAKQKGYRRSTASRRVTDTAESPSGWRISLPAWLARSDNQVALASQDSGKSQTTIDDLAPHYAVIYATDQADTSLMSLQRTRAVWGVYPGQLREYAIDEVWSLIREIQELPDFAAMTQLIADLRLLIAKKRGRKSKPAPLPQRVTGVENGRTLEHLTPFELVKLTDPDLEGLFHDNYENQSLLHYSYSGEVPENTPPLICCIDTSASMHQQAARSLTRIAWAKAVALALHATAAEQRRAFHAICFAAAGQLKTFSAPHGRLSAHGLVELAKCYFGGGTHLATPLGEALALAGTSSVRAADIVMITDGEAPLDNNFLTRFGREQRRLGLRLHTIFIDGEHKQLRAISRTSFAVASENEQGWRNAIAGVGAELQTER